jgi:Asp/Glu/hydantoin racemase
MRILVINPNSNQAVTRGMADALKVLEITGGPKIECVTLEEGPFGIESQADIEAVTLPLKKLVTERDDANAYVIACYSDPGLQLCREGTLKPVLGIQECGVLTALAQGDRFGVIALANLSIKRHLRYLRQMGVLERLACERAVNLSVHDSATGTETFDRLCEVGKKLRDLDGAETVILGCAGMAAHRLPLERYLKIPVIDPVQAATSMAIGAVLLKG